MASHGSARGRKLEELREDLWPGSENRIWRASQETGYCCVPRVLPLLLLLMNNKAVIEGRSCGDCGKVYLELLARDRGQGLVEIASEGEHAYLSGYTGTRASRTWRERVEALAKAGFVEVKAKPNQRIGMVLLIHPHLAVTRLRQLAKLPADWWDAYQRFQREYGASMPKVPSEPTASGKKLVLVKPSASVERSKRRRGSSPPRTS